MGITLEQARGELKVSEFRASPAKTVNPNTLATDAARTMIEEKIGCLPVATPQRHLDYTTLKTCDRKSEAP